MEDEKSFLDGVPTEGQIKIEEAEESAEVEAPAESSTENTEETESPTQEGEQTETAEEATEVVPENNTPDETKPEPFHNHPRWKAKMKELNEAKQYNTQLTEKMQSLADTVEKLQTGQKQTPEAPEEIPSWFSGMFGEDQQAWSELKSMSTVNQEKIVTQVTEKLKQEQVSQQEATQRWNDWVGDEIKTLSEATGFDFDDAKNESERNALLKVVRDFAPMTPEGYYNIPKAYEIYTALAANKSKPTEDMTERKKLASNTTPSKATADIGKTKIANSHSLRGSWDTILNK